MGSEFMRRNKRHTQSRIPQTKYAYDPYSALQPFHVVGKSPASLATQNREVAKKLLPAGTLRLDLYASVPFIPFPEYVLDRARQRTEAPALAERPETLMQVFFGQLPYKVSDHMIIWLCETLAESEVLYIERVLQDKSRKGCMQVFVDEDDADYIISALNKRVLFDATGVWQAQNDEQVEILEAHCLNEVNRFKGFPFRTMVVEKSTSTYVRRHRQPPTARRSRSSTPPPQNLTPQETQAQEVVEPSPEQLYNTDYEPYTPAEEQCSPCQCPGCVGPEGPYSSYHQQQLASQSPPEYVRPPAYIQPPEYIRPPEYITPPQYTPLITAEYDVVQYQEADEHQSRYYGEESQYGSGECAPHYTSGYDNSVYYYPS